jgi:hypothetical protein
MHPHLDNLLAWVEASLWLPHSLMFILNLLAQSFLPSLAQCALMAVSAVTALVAGVLEEQQFVSRPAEMEALILEGMGTDAGREGQAPDEVAAQANAEFNAHVSTIEQNTDAIISACFSLLPRLGEVESMVGRQHGVVCAHQAQSSLHLRGLLLFLSLPH